MTIARIGAGFAAYWAIFVALSLALAYRGWVATMVGVIAVVLSAATALLWQRGVLSSRMWSGQRVRPRTVSAPPRAG